MRRASKQVDAIDDLAAVIGHQMTTRLCEALGGTRIYVPRQFGHNHPVVAAIGVKAAALLADHFYGTRLDLPKAHLRRQRVIEMAQSGRMTIAEAALACDYSERHVYRLIKPEPDDQLSMLDLM